MTLRTCQSNIKNLWEAPSTFYQNNKIDKLSVSRNIEFPVLKVPCKIFKNIMKIFKRFSPDLIHFDNVLKYQETEEFKGIFLDPLKFSNINTELDDKEKKILEDLQFDFKNLNINYHIKSVSYDNYKLSTLMEWFLPKDHVMSGFTIVGHIVHINLKEELIPFKHSIGELLLDKVANVDCIVSKLNSIDNEFRTFQLDLLAGNENYVTSVKEHGCEFCFDFSKVYWNSRLSTEHYRITEAFVSTDIVYDACAGVGPFSIPAAKKGCRVISNDLNSESCKWFQENMKLNSTKRKPVKIDLHNLDASEFIVKVVLPDIVNYSKTEERKNKYFLLMNLPAMAINFLSAIVDNDQIELITDANTILNVRCYCFIGKECPREMIEEKIRTQLGSRVDNYNLRLVRNVAPSKDMYCAEIAVNISATAVEPSTKRFKRD